VFTVTVYKCTTESKRSEIERRAKRVLINNFKKMIMNNRPSVLKDARAGFKTLSAPSRTWGLHKRKNQ